MEQTAVEWLYDQMLKPLSKWPDNLWENAKEMEKQQIMDAFEEGMFHHLNGYTPPEYYEETFNTKEK